MNARMMAAAGLAAILLAAGGAMATVDIELIAVGSPGNPPDTRYPTLPYGAVGYVYNVGKYEVTNAQYCEFLNAVDPDGTDPHDLYSSGMGSEYGGISFAAGNPNGSKYQVLSGRGNKPVNYVNFWDTCRFANWLHNDQGGGDTETGAYTLTPQAIADNTVTRNPGWQWAVTSEDEWYKAAYYNPATDMYFDYPIGTNTAPTAEAPPGTDMVNGSANYDYVVGDVTDVGAYTAKPTASPYGTFDQAGNVWEWNESIIRVSTRGLRGGSFYTTDYDLLAAPRARNHPGNHSAYIGFRVSQVPEPASMALLAFGGAPILMRRRKPQA